MTGEAGEVWVCAQTGAVRSQRPFALQKIFLNRTPQQVVKLVGLSYALCGVAQQFTSALALAAAQDQLEDFQVASGLEAVRWESLREHFMSLTQLAVALEVIPHREQAQWLQGIGNWCQSSASNTIKQQQATTKLQSWGGEILWQACVPTATAQELKQAVAAEMATGSPLGQVFEQLRPLEPLLSSVTDPCLEDGSEITAMNCCVHQLSSEVEANMLAQDWGFWAETPAIENRAVENSALGRQVNRVPALAVLAQQMPLSARVLARWLEMDDWLSPDRSVVDLYGFYRSGDQAMAWVETARGRLWHFVQCVAGGVKKYAISAPTEWNFHPRGRFAQWVQTLKTQTLSPEVWRAQVSIVAQVMDPCVPLRFQSKGLI